MKYLLLFALLFGFSSCSQKIPVNISEVTVITTEKSTKLSNEQIEFLKSSFSNFKPIDRNLETEWTHTFKIKSEKFGGTWYYNSKAGHIAKLNYQLRPRYLVTNLNKFNEVLLGF